MIQKTKGLPSGRGQGRKCMSRAENAGDSLPEPQENARQKAVSCPAGPRERTGRDRRGGGAGLLIPAGGSQSWECPWGEPQTL